MIVRNYVGVDQPRREPVGCAAAGGNASHPRSVTDDPRGVVVQSVRTPACHAGGRGFEPRRPRQSKALMRRDFAAFLLRAEDTPKGATLISTLNSAVCELSIGSGCIVIRLVFARRIVVTTGAATALPSSSDRSRAARAGRRRIWPSRASAGRLPPGLPLAMPRADGAHAERRVRDRRLHRIRRRETPPAHLGGGCGRDANDWINSDHIHLTCSVVRLSVRDVSCGERHAPGRKRRGSRLRFRTLFLSRRLMGGLSSMMCG